MRIHNLHERVLDVSADEAAPLLDHLGQPDDSLFPAPQWEPMVLEGPLAPGVKGGHGPMRYHVSAYEPGRRVEFTAEPGIGLEGHHAFELEPTTDGKTRLQHVLDARALGSMCLAWPIAVRSLHNAILEDLLDRAEAVLGTGPKQPTTWSPWVRLMRRFDGVRAKETTPSETELVKNALDRVDHTDAFAIKTWRGMPTDPQVWADTLFRDFPPWVKAAMKLRQALVGLVGIERETLKEAFRTHASTDDEVVLGTDAKHLDFRVSIRREPDRVVATTVLKLRGERGEFYWRLVRRIHPIVMRSMLNRVARKFTQARSCLAVGGIGAGSEVSPRRNVSTPAAQARPSAIAHTIRD